jgi:hypothetical protein
MEKDEIKIGDTFNVVLRKGIYLKTLGSKGISDSKEAAGRKLGPFIATKVTAQAVEAGDRIFTFANWTVQKQE